MISILFAFKLLQLSHSRVENVHVTVCAHPFGRWITTVRTTGVDEGDSSFSLSFQQQNQKKITSAMSLLVNAVI
eukprot:s6247_g2.t1